MDILLILSLSVMISRLMYGSQSDTDKANPRERVVDKLAKLVLREGAFGIIIAFVLFVIITGLPFK
jgi:hypothetical protein